MLGRTAPGDSTTDEPLCVDRAVRQYRALAQVLTALNTARSLPEILHALLGALATGIDLAGATLTLTDPVPLRSVWPSAVAVHDVQAIWTLEVVLCHETHLFGNLQLIRSHARPDFDVHEHEFATALARQMAVLCERERVDEEARRSVQRAEALREIGRALSTELDLDRFLTVTRKQVARIIEHESAWLGIWDEQLDTLDIRFYMANGARLPEMEVCLPRGKGLGWSLIDERQTVNAPDYIAECQRRGLRATGFGDEPRVTTNPWLGVPLLIGGTWSGQWRSSGPIPRSGGKKRRPPKRSRDRSPPRSRMPGAMPRRNDSPRWIR